MSETEFTCEVCSVEGVDRVGIWDYCPNGHTYVGKRAEAALEQLDKAATDA